MQKTVCITGGSGFIGISLTKLFLSSGYIVINVDKLSPVSTPDVTKWINIPENKYHFYKLDINNKEGMDEVFNKHKPDYVIHSAAGSHVDNSITHPELTLQDNVIGTLSLLEVIKKYYNNLEVIKKNAFRLIAISTDEVYGELHTEEDLFYEDRKYEPTSIYAISKACSDFLVRNYIRTWNIPAIITNCCNNYGPFQHPEKLIPMIISNALSSKNVNIHGNGKNIRDWIFVDDHSLAIKFILENGKIGDSYCIGARCEKSNIEIARLILNYLDEKFIPPTLDERYIDLIKFGADRPGNDKRYGVDNTKLLSLGWKPTVSFEKGLKETVDWYVNNQSWWKQFSTSAKVW
jgi:dTDP-glucose 4,6-dehydratase